jgi:sugar/nucleoside kinase (ribokinase family)
MKTKKVTCDDLKLSSYLPLDPAAVAACRVVTGFDGFIDEMITLVADRYDLQSFTAVRNFSEFAATIAASAGHSSLREIIVRHVHAGGCAVNLADGLASLGVHVDCFATCGYPPHPAFGAIAQRCHGFHSWGREPGRTLAFEFEDGKVMFSVCSHLADFTPAHVELCLRDGEYARACEQAHVIVLTDWSLYPHMTHIWDLLRKKVFSHLTHRPHFFFDLVDPTSRSETDIREMMKSLAMFEEHGEVTLGLNGNEANHLCRLLDRKTTDAQASIEETTEQTSALCRTLGISRVVIHRSRYAISASLTEISHAFAAHFEKPQKSTGAGDRFNAGYCLGLALSLTAEQCLDLGNRVAGVLIREGRSACLEEL